MADPHPANMTAQLSASIASMISKQVKALIPDILKSLHSATSISPIAGHGPDATVNTRIHSPVKQLSAENTIADLPSQALPEVAEPQKISFKHALLSVCHEHNDSTNMQTQRKGEYLSIKVDENLAQHNISELQNTLIGKLSLAQGDTLYSLESLKSTLGQIWGVTDDWNLVPLGRGYYNIQLSVVEVRNKVLDRRSWNLRPGLMRIQR